VSRSLFRGVAQEYMARRHGHGPHPAECKTLAGGSLQMEAEVSNILNVIVTLDVCHTAALVRGAQHPMTWHGLAVMQTGRARPARYVRGRQSFLPVNSKRLPDPANKDVSLSQAKNFGKR
jgi:hypothetical protein